MLNLVLTEESGAAAAARRALIEGNGELPETVRDDVVLLVSELVTNAVLHAGAGPERPLQVELLTGPRWVVVTVSDEGPGFTWRPSPEGRTNASGGWDSSSWIRSQTAGASSARRPGRGSGSRSCSRNDRGTNAGRHGVLWPRIAAAGPGPLAWIHAEHSGYSAPIIALYRSAGSPPTAAKYWSSREWSSQRGSRDPTRAP